MKRGSTGVSVSRLKRSFFLWGVVWVGLGVAAGGLLSGDPLRYLEGSLLLLLFLIFPLLYWVESRVLRPVERIVESNRRLLEGDMDGAIIPPSEMVDSEIGEIMETRNRVIERLLEAQRSLEDEKRRLEEELERELRKTSVARPLAGRIIRYLSEEGHLSDHCRFMVGRRLAEEVREKDIKGFVTAFEEMGLGSLTLLSLDQENKVASFSGRDLIEKVRGSREPTGYLTLGYLCGALSTLYGGKAKGVEKECESMGDKLCLFIIHWEA